jgi:hypothetical protein
MKPLFFGGLALGATLAASVSVAQAQTMSAAERQLLGENLAQADANGDGALSASEFEVLINLNAEDNLGMAARIARTGRYGTAFARVDTDGNGLLTQAEPQAMAQ